MPERGISVSLNANSTYRIFRFVPLETREYKISSAGTYDTCVELLDANGNYLSENDDGGTSYTITYNLNGGTNNASNPAAYYSEAVVLKNPTRPQYIFEGWYTDSACKNKITQIPAGARQNYVLYAKWQKVNAPGKAKLTSASNSKSQKIAVKYKK